MHANESITVISAVDASVVPTSTKVTLQQGEQVYIMPAMDDARVPALQGRKKIAQGNALGERGVFVTSPVRATQNPRTTCSGRNPHSVSPFQGLFCFSLFPQGVALGYLIPPRWG